MGLEDRIDRPRTVSQKDSPSRGFVFRIEWGMFLKKKKFEKKFRERKGRYCIRMLCLHEMFLKLGKRERCRLWGVDSAFRLRKAR